jgi:signal peptidase I
MSNPRKSFRILIFACVVFGVCAATFLVSELFYLHPYWTFRAFRVASMSMCPTICKDERVFVQTNQETPYVPKRGDVIGMEFGAERSLFLKRVQGFLLCDWR